MLGIAVAKRNSNYDRKVIRDSQLFSDKVRIRNQIISRDRAQSILLRLQHNALGQHPDIKYLPWRERTIHAQVYESWRPEKPIVCLKDRLPCSFIISLYTGCFKSLHSEFFHAFLQSWRPLLRS